MTPEYLENIISFLKSRGWIEVIGNRNTGLLYFAAPQTLGFETTYEIGIPNRNDFTDLVPYINNILKILSGIYQLSKDDLELLFSKDNTILSLKIEDEDVIEGKVKFFKFEEFIVKLRKILLDTASFTIMKRALTDYTPKEAIRYLNLCNFLQTEKGSFVAKIELPENEKLFESTLLPDQEITSGEVNKKLVNVLNFVNDDVFNSSSFDTNFIRRHADNINLNILNDIEDLYNKTEFSNIKFNFVNNTIETKIETKEVFEGKMKNLSDFVTIVKDNIYNTFKWDFKAQITELKSKDPATDHNTIRVVGIVKNVISTVVVILNSEDYKLAIDAHENKKYVRIKGLFKTEATQYKVTELESFVIAENIPRHR